MYDFASDGVFEARRDDHSRKLLRQALRHPIVVFDLKTVRNNMADEMNLTFLARGKIPNQTPRKLFVVDGEIEHIVARIAAVEQQA